MYKILTKPSGPRNGSNSGMPKAKAAAIAAKRAWVAMVACIKMVGKLSEVWLAEITQECGEDGAVRLDLGYDQSNRKVGAS